MALELKEYQRRCLDELEAYLALAPAMGAKRAFMDRTERPYHSVPQLPELPYVCLRVPTGGGKTLMACHAVGLAAQRYLQTEHAVCLWLVPTQVIRDQTLQALRDRSHPYRQALDARFSGQVEILDLPAALYVQRPVLAGATTVIVSTLAALRVENTDGRKVYESAGALSNHFSALSPELEAVLERDEAGVLPHSLCNVLRLHRPLVVVDEAHNARTPLSFDTLARFNPSCILEFTATPQTAHNPEAGLCASNVLCHVSALELKAEAMIKLPIELVAQPEWRQTIGAAVACQRRLEALASEQRGYLRPLVLLQAQPRREGKSTIDVESVKSALVNDCRVPAEQVAVVTGDQREIDGVDLRRPDCAIRFIITVQALKEGWDCPFAYVLCSVAELSSKTAVEQILGRVLRMPGARRQEHDELNCAYAFVASPRFVEAAEALRDGLLANGCQRIEVQDLVRGEEPPAPVLTGLFGEVREPVSAAPDLTSVASAWRDKLEYYPASGELGFTGEMPDAVRDQLRSACATAADEAAVERLYVRSRGGVVASGPTPDREAPMLVPALAVAVDGVLELFEDQHLDVDWRLSQMDARLSEAEFGTALAAAAAAELDVDAAGRLAVRFVEQVQEQLALLAWEPGWTVEKLAVWLDNEIPHPDIVQHESSLFIHNALTYLVEQRGLSLEQLAARKFRLRDALNKKTAAHRQQVQQQSFQRALFADEAQVSVDPTVCFRLEPGAYAPNGYYEGYYKFRKHWHHYIGELAPKGDETDCALDIDQHPQVKRWVRNLAKRRTTSFWLPTSTDLFYPDFVAELTDGRFLVVEYKGEHLRTAEDAKEKEAVGRLWAERSSGRCLFVMITGPARPALDGAIGA